MHSKPSIRRRCLILGAPLVGLVAACGSSGTDSASAEGSGTAGFADITGAVLANENVVLSGDSIIRLPAGLTTYSGVISGTGSLTLASGDGSACTIAITQASTFTLPVERQVQSVSKTIYPGAGYALTIVGSNPPAVTVEPMVTLRIGTNSAADNHPNFIVTADSRNEAALVNGEVNLTNILNNGKIELNSSHFILLGQISGSGTISQLPDVWGDNSIGGMSAFEGVLSFGPGGNFGTNHVAASIPKAKAILNEGSWLVWSPPASVVTVTQNIYEAAFGSDINFHPIGTSRIVMSGVYGHTDNSPHGSPNLVDPGLSDPGLNLAKVIYRGGPNDINGNDGSYRGINIEAGGTVQWGDGTHANFFLPSAPSPAAVAPPLGNKNAYINLHRGGTLAFNYNGPVTLNVGITGGGGGPNKSASIGVGNVTVMSNPGNDVTMAQPQNYNGVTTVGSGAILRLGTGTPVPLRYVTVRPTGKTTVLQATYSGDASLLTAESTGGVATNAIINDGQLIVQNTASDIVLSNVSGSGSLTHDGTASTTLRNNRYTGNTTINRGRVSAGTADAFGTGRVTNNANLALATGVREIAIGGGFTQGEGGTLTLSIGGIAPVIDHDHLSVTGAAVLGGTLALDFSTIPPSGQRFTLLRATGGVTGSFKAIASPSVSVLPGNDGSSFFVTVQ